MVTIITNLPERRLAKHDLKFAARQLDEILEKSNPKSEAKLSKRRAWLTPLYDSTVPPYNIDEAKSIVNDKKMFANISRGQLLELIRAFMRDDAKKLGIDCPEAYLTSGRMGIISAIFYGLLGTIMVNPATGITALGVGLAQEAIMPAQRGSFIRDANISTFTQKLTRSEFTKHSIPAHETDHALVNTILGNDHDKIKSINPEYMPSEKTVESLRRSYNFPMNLLYRFNAREIHARAHGKEYAESIATKA